MSEWKEYKLGDVAEIVGGGTPNTDIPEYWNGEIAWITPRDLAKNSTRFISKGERNISINGLKSSSAKLLPKGTVLLSTRAPIGYLSIANNEVSTNQGFRSLIPNDRTTTDFLYYLLKNNVDYLISQGEGTTFGELAGSVLKSISLSFPPLPEQKSIASVLSSLDDKIDLLHRQNKTLEVLAETLFRQWFVRRPELIEGEEAEEGWETGKLGEYVQFLKGKKPNNAFEDYLDGLMPQILIETFDTGKTLFSEPQNMVIANEKDILMVMDGASSGRAEIGFTGIVGSTIGLFEPISSFNYPLFIFYLLKSSESHIREHTTGSAIPHADKALILNLDVHYSNIERVIEFENIAEIWFEKKKANRNQIRTLTRLRDTLLPKLMSGEVRVKEKDNKTE
jgi:type I restriction enzyme S subunit